VRERVRFPVVGFCVCVCVCVCVCEREREREISVRLRGSDHRQPQAYLD
jgi:hypothetical protein